MVGQLDAAQQALQIHRDTADRANEAIGLQNVGVSWLNLGDLVQAKRDLEGALLLIRAIGNRYAEGSTLCLLAVVALWQGDATHALGLAVAAQEIAEVTQARGIELLGVLQVAGAELALGHHAAARQAYTRAREQALGIGDPQRHDASAGLARVALAEGDTAAAMAALQPLLEHVAAGGSLDGTQERDIELTCHRALAQAGDARAAAWLTRAYSGLIKGASTIIDESLRQCHLQNVPYHREILAAWAASGLAER